ncbi:MAG: hypothetical protein ACYCZ6_10535 [Polaromonas sp.]
MREVARIHGMAQLAKDAGFGRKLVQLTQIIKELEFSTESSCCRSFCGGEKIPRFF